VSCNYSRHRGHDGVFGAASAGFFLLLLGFMFVIRPNLFVAVQNFFVNPQNFSPNFEIVQISTYANVTLPAPIRNHPVVYEAVEQFCLIFGIFQVVLLIFRFAVRSHIYGVARNAGSIVFWLGAGLLTSRTLLDVTIGPQGTLTGVDVRWFTFWAGIIILAGLSLIVRAIIMAAGYHRPQP
jgi:hypothetical protein